MHFYAKIYYTLFALAAAGGGAMGFVRARSRASLIAGSVSGVVLLVAAFLLTEHPVVGLILGLLVSVSLAGKFLPDFMHKKALIPGGLMALFSLGGIVVTLLEWYQK